MRGLCGKAAQGAFFTPWSVAAMIAEVARVTRPDTWALDPACGGGVLLIAALELCRQRFGELAACAMTLLGVELDPRTAQIARASLLLAGADPAQFWIGCASGRMSR
jgi:type I restriction-modification system DNA methylase subunit